MLRIFKNTHIALYVSVFSLFASALLPTDIAFAQSIFDKVEEAENAMSADDLERFSKVMQEIVGDEAAISQLKKSADAGDARAGLYYSIILVDARGSNRPQAIEKAMPYLRKASDNNVKFSNLFMLFALSEMGSDPDEFEYYLIKAAEKGDIPNSVMQKITADIAKMNQRDEALASAPREVIEQKAREGSVRRQIYLAERYSEGGDDRFPRNVAKALDWARMADEVNEDAFGYMAAQIESAYADELPNPTQQRIAQFIHRSEVAKLAALQKTVNACQTPACAFQEVWAYADITGDNALTIAELARFQRNLVKFAVSENGEMQSAEELLALHGALVLILPMGASSVMNSFDYDGDGRLSPEELVGEEDMAVLAGITSAETDEGLDFATLGERLRTAVSSLPLPF